MSLGDSVAFYGEILNKRPRNFSFTYLLQTNKNQIFLLYNNINIDKICYLLRYQKFKT